MEIKMILKPKQRLPLGANNVEIEKAYDFDPKDPLYTDIGPRDFKYEHNRGFFSKFSTRLNRLLTSLKKRISIFKLLLNLKD